MREKAAVSWRFESFSDEEEELKLEQNEINKNDLENPLRELRAALSSVTVAQDMIGEHLIQYNFRQNVLVFVISLLARQKT